MVGTIKQVAENAVFIAISRLSMGLLALVLVPILLSGAGRMVDRLDILSDQMNDTTRIQAVMLNRIKNIEEDVDDLEGRGSGDRGGREYR